MKNFLILGTVLALCVPMPAQTPKGNLLEVYDGSREKVSRGTLGSFEGECLQRLPGSSFGGFRKAVGFRAVTFDPNGYSIETFWVVLRKADRNGKPDISPSGLIYSEGPFKTRYNWRFDTQNVKFKTPQVLPEGDVFFGLRVGVAPSPGWPKDGLSISESSGYYDAKPNYAGEHPRKGVDPSSLWNVRYFGSKPISVGEYKRAAAWDMGLLFENTVIQPYAVDPKGRVYVKSNKKDFGLAGLWPDLTDLEKYGYKAKFGWGIHEANMPGGFGFVFFSPKLLKSPLPIPPYGNWHVDPSSLWFYMSQMAVLDSKGNGSTAELNPPALVRTALVGTTFYAQALVASPTTGKVLPFSNWCGMHF